MKYLIFVLAALMMGCSQKPEVPKQVFPNDKLSKQVQEQNGKDLWDAQITWITVSCAFTGENHSDKKLVIWYNSGFGDKELRKDEGCGNPQNLIMIGYQDGVSSSRNTKTPDGRYNVETALPYDYSVVNQVITDVLDDIKLKGSKL